MCGTAQEQMNGGKGHVCCALNCVKLFSFFLFLKKEDINKVNELRLIMCMLIWKIYMYNCSQ